MAYAAQDVGMPVFLFIAGIFNIIFVGRAIRDCFLVFVLGGEDGDWAPSSSFGCNFQGFYSVLGSISGMLSSMLLAFFTLRLADAVTVDAIPTLLPSPRTTAVTSVAIFLFAIVIALLPVVATGGYIASGDGFCYIDWFKPGQSVIMFLITLPTFVITIAIYCRVLQRGTWPNSRDILLLLASFISAWVLWLPAALIGWSNISFPSGFMITGGILGHAQALLNPYLFGIRWRDSVQQLGGTHQLDGQMGKMADEAALPTEQRVPSTPTSPPSLPPSPPGSASASLAPTPPLSDRAASPPSSPPAVRVAWQ